MKMLSTIATVFLSAILLQAAAQPKGFVTGSITLADGSIITGFIKDDIRKKAAVFFIAENSSVKKVYDGDQLTGASLDSNQFLCIKGDFFKLVSDGELSFLQKASNASSKPVYIGTEANFINGTPGKPGDYFLYNKRVNQLQLLTSKNFTDVTSRAFTDCEAAIRRAKELGNDIGQLKDAVAIFNSRNK